MWSCVQHFKCCFIVLAVDKSRAEERNGKERKKRKKKDRKGKERKEVERKEVERKGKECRINENSDPFTSNLRYLP